MRGSTAKRLRRLATKRAALPTQLIMWADRSVHHQAGSPRWVYQQLKRNWKETPWMRRKI